MIRRLFRNKGREGARQRCGAALKSGLYCAAAMMLAAGLGGCVADRTEFDNPTPPAGGRAATFTVTVPGMKTPSTRALTTDKEQEIAEIDVVIFDNSNQSLLEYHCVPNIAPSGNSWQFNVSDIDHANNITAAIIANASNEVSKALTTLANDNGGNYTGVHKLDFLEALLATREGKWNTSNNNYWRIPMYGEVKVTGNIHEQGALNADLVRMLARVDVLNDKHPEPSFGPRPGDFVLTKVHVVHYNTCGRVAPKWQPDPTDPTNRPVNAGKILWQNDGDELTYEVVEDGTEMDIYLFECQAQSGATVGPENPAPDRQTRLIFEGLYYNSNGEPEHYYYPVDFRKDRNPDDQGGWDEAQEYIHVLRNYCYKFHITEVSGRGYDNMGEAVAAMGVMSNMKTSLLVVDEGGIRNIVWNGEYFLGTEDREVTLGGSAGSLATVKVSTNYAEGWKIDTDKGTNGIEYTDGTDWLSATPATPGDPKSSLELTVLTDNLSENERTAVVHLKAGRLTYAITVTQGSGYNFVVSTSHVNGDAIPPLGAAYDITVTGTDWPQIAVRAVVAGTDDEVATSATINANIGTGTDNSESITVNRNPKWYTTGGRMIEFQWSIDGTTNWFAISKGGQTGMWANTPTLNPNIIAGAGQRITVTIPGEYPNNYVMVQARSNGMDTQQQYIGNSKTGTINIPKNETGAARDVVFESRRLWNDGWDSWIEFATISQPIGNVVLSTGRVVANADVAASGTTWAQAMGIDTRYNTESFTENNQPNYPMTKNTGCGAYFEKDVNDPKAGVGQWRLPTYNELGEMYSKRDEIGNMVTTDNYWSAREYGSTGNQAYYVYFGQNNEPYFGFNGKGTSAYVRCIRDL